MDTCGILSRGLRSRDWGWHPSGKRYPPLTEPPPPRGISSPEMWVGARGLGGIFSCGSGVVIPPGEVGTSPGRSVWEWRCTLGKEGNFAIAIVRAIANRNSYVYPQWVPSRGVLPISRKLK